MMLVELRSEGTSIVQDNVVIENNPAGFGTKLPGGFVELPDGKLFSRRTGRFDGEQIF